MIASLIRRIIGIPPSVSGRFRDAGKRFRHARGLPGPGVVRVDVIEGSEVRRGSRVPVGQWPDRAGAKFHNCSTANTGFLQRQDLLWPSWEPPLSKFTNGARTSCTDRILPETWGTKWYPIDRANSCSPLKTNLVFERHAEKIAVAPDQPTKAHRAELIE